MTDTRVYWKTPLAKFSSDMLSYCLFLILLAVDVGITSRDSLGRRAPGKQISFTISIFSFEIDI